MELLGITGLRFPKYSTTKWSLRIARDIRTTSSEPQDFFIEKKEKINKYQICVSDLDGRVVNLSLGIYVGSLRAQFQLPTKRRDKLLLG